MDYFYAYQFTMKFPKLKSTGMRAISRTSEHASQIDFADQFDSRGIRLTMTKRHLEPNTVGLNSPTTWHFHIWQPLNEHNPESVQFLHKQR